MRFAWLSDIHLDHLLPMGKIGEFEAVLAEIVAQDAEALLISGDIGEAPTTAAFLVWIAERFHRPIYFVLGNHDFYRGSIADVRERMRALTAESSRINWLPAVGVVPLSATIALVGHDGWYDGRYGDYANSTYRLSDYMVISDLTGLTKEERLIRLNALGDEAAAYLREVLPEALAAYEHVFVLTHIPPFKEACWYQGKISSDNALPHFACKATGDVLRELMLAHPHRQMTVLCGHTHGEGEAQILDNLLVLTSGTDYGKPRIEALFDEQ